LDSAGIEALIIDGYDDITKGLINYQIFDSSCTLVLGTVRKFGSSAGINKLSLNVSFENPVNSELSLICEMEFTSIQVTDLSGRSIIFKSSGANRFDVSTLPAGFYVLTAVNDQIVRRSFVKL
jgi:hypothetical protein